MRKKVVSVSVDQVLYNKLKKISLAENRTVNRQIVYSARKYVQQYEKLKGEINGDSENDLQKKIEKNY